MRAQCKNTKNSFKRGKTRMTNSRLVRVLNNFLRKGTSSLGSHKAKIKGSLELAYSMSLLVGTLTPDLFPIAHAYQKMTG